MEELTQKSSHCPLLSLCIDRTWDADVGPEESSLRSTYPPLIQAGNMSKSMIIFDSISPLIAKNTYDTLRLDTCFWFQKRPEVYYHTGQVFQSYQSIFLVQSSTLMNAAQTWLTCPNSNECGMELCSLIVLWPLSLADRRTRFAKAKVSTTLQTYHNLHIFWQPVDHKCKSGKKRDTSSVNFEGIIKCHGD